MKTSGGPSVPTWAGHLALWELMKGAEVERHDRWERGK